MTDNTADLNLDVLEAIARAAAPGPWVRATSGTRSWALVLSASGTADEYRVSQSADDDDAEHIATFDPPTVLALITRLREAEQAMTELTKDEEVTVEGSIFRWSELPDVLGRNMRAVTEAQQEAKGFYLRLREAEAVIAKVMPERLFAGEAEPIATDPILRGVDLAMDRLVRQDCFTERTIRILDELRAEVLGVASTSDVRAHYKPTEVVHAARVYRDCGHPADVEIGRQSSAG